MTCDIMLSKSWKELTDSATPKLAPINDAPCTTGFFAILASLDIGAVAASMTPIVALNTLPPHDSAAS